MLLRQMKCFVTVVDCNNFTEAAEQLYISQSSISQQIQALEKDLGTDLLVREKRKFWMTPAGEYFYQHAKAVLSEVDNIYRETVRIGQDKEAQLRVGYLNIYDGKELHYTVKEFVSMYPEITLTMICGTHEELYDKMRFGQIDMVFNDQRRAFRETHENLIITKAPCYITVSQSHYLSKFRIVDQEDLKYTPCILVSPKDQWEHEENYYRDTFGFKGNFLFAENMSEAHFMVISNRGFLPLEKVGTMSSMWTGTERIPLYCKNKQMYRNYFACWPKERSNYYIEEFARILKEKIITAGEE